MVSAKLYGHSGAKMTSFFDSTSHLCAVDDPLVQAEPFAVSSATKDITPPWPTVLAATGDTRQTWRRVQSRLEANAALVVQGELKILFLAADILYFSAELIVFVESVAALFGIESDNIILTASHTHYAPATDATKPKLGGVNLAYRDYLHDQLRKLIEEVGTGAAVAVTLEHSSSVTALNVNRRRLWHFPTLTRAGFRVGCTAVLAPNPDAPRDSVIDVLKIIDASGQIVCLIWKFACHPTCFPESDSVSAEYPGHARQLLRDLLGRDLPVLFWQGFTGDVRPNLDGRHSLRERIEVLRRGPRFGGVTMQDWENWSHQVADTLFRCVQASTSHRIDAPLSVKKTEIPLSRLIDSPDPERLQGRTMDVHRLEFSGQLAIFFVSAEVCTPYLKALASSIPTICVGYAGDVFGYLPSEQQVREGGYEGGEFFARFGLKGKMRAGFEKIFVNAARNLA